MSYKYVYATKSTNTDEWEDIGLGRYLIDVNEDTQPGHWVSWYAVLDNPGITSDEYGGSGVVGNKVTGSNQNNDSSDTRDGYALWFLGDEYFDIDFVIDPVRNPYQSPNVADNFQATIWFHDTEGGEWSPLDTAILRSYSNVEFSVKDAKPGIYLVDIWEMHANNYEPGQEAQLTYDLDVFVA